MAVVVEIYRFFTFTQLKNHSLFFRQAPICHLNFYKDSTNFAKIPKTLDKRKKHLCN